MVVPRAVYYRFVYGKRGFSGKTAVPHCTSGGSGLGDSTKNMQALAPGAKVLDGKRFSASASPDELKKWAEQF